MFLPGVAGVCTLPVAPENNNASKIVREGLEGVFFFRLILVPVPNCFHL